MFPDYYERLGLSPNASREDIKKAYRKLSLEFHPDKNHRPDAHEKFISINEAYLILYDEEARAKYDIEYGINFNTGENTFEKEYKVNEDPFEDADLNDWSKKAKEQGSQYAKMAFDEFSKLVLGFVKETGFQLGNTILVFFGLILTISGGGNLLFGLFSAGDLGNPILGIIMLPIGIWLWTMSNKNWENRENSIK